MTGKLRFTALILAVMIALSAFAAIALISHEHSGACIGEDCPVCAAISICRKILKTLLPGILMLFAVLFFTGLLTLRADINGALPLTPVSLKVKMSN